VLVRLEINSAKRVKYSGVLHESQGGKVHPTYNKKERKANWIGHILCRNCLLKQAGERKIEGTGRRGRRRWMVRDQRKFILKVQ
jgi:hypothetical protein